LQLESGTISPKRVALYDRNNQIIFDLKKTFELRHIFCHEFATNIYIEKNEILRCLNSSKLFLNQTNNYILDLLYPNAPETQVEMNKQANDVFKESEKRLTQLILKIKEESKDLSYLPLNVAHLEESIMEWKKYRKIKAKLDASIVEGGSIYPCIYAGSLTTTTEEKIESLQREYALCLRIYERKLQILKS
jgi:hypothetical protein